ncbi:MAG: DNA (cytosine-5-)-methyltransferase, partial [Hyphomicrobiales bacterium]|nr:DNA (cytosine-5-)-methyltransferase [Hyphomicrobiales bacterium]
MSEAPTFYEFFAGGGFARLGLGPGWRCLFANDWEEAKAASYRANWGAGEMRVTDVHALTLQDLPGRADLAWASFPCQDLSLAGAGAGLSGARSGAFWGFHALIRGLVEGGRAPALIALENVVGLLSANCGADFAALARAFDGLGYGLSALVLDAAAFVPQSRPRLFVVARAAGVEVPGRATPDPALAPASL